MVDAVVFSKNRPAQLDLFLRTFYGSVNSNEIFNLKVIYKATEKQYQLGYNLIKRMYPCLVEEEVDLKEQTFAHFDKNHFCFFTDDSFFYRLVDTTNLLNTLAVLQKNECFSLRLGLNTKDNHGWQCHDLRLTKDFGQEEDIIWYNPKEYDYNSQYGYTMSVDGHIYHHSLIERLKTLNFSNPNQLEGSELSKLADSITKMYCFDKSVLVINPINIVSDLSNNWNGEKYGRTTEELNQNFLKGNFLTFKPFEPNSTHYEVELDYVFPVRSR